jgi:hypothetical protein
MKQKRSYNLLVAIILSAAFVIVALFYWSDHNAASYCGHTRDELVTLADTSYKIRYDGSMPRIIHAKARLQHKYVEKDLKPAGDKFFTAWKSAGKLDSVTAVGYKSTINETGSWLVRKNSTWKYNQLLAVAIIFLIFITFLYIAVFTNMLRDPVGRSSQVETERLFNFYQQIPPGDVKPAFSLSRTQLAVWITIIGSIYTYGVLWDQYDALPINTTALILMGISVGTYTVGAIVDFSEIEQGMSRHQDMQMSSGNFIKDILTDQNGMSIHRFQNVVWTIIAIIVYFYRYSNPLDGQKGPLPELDTTLLALTGISGAAYLTLKTRENAAASKKLLEQLSITLEPDNLTDAEKLDISNSAEGLRKAIVTIHTDVPGEETHAAPSSPQSKFLFIAKKLEIDKSHRITATWEGTVLGNTMKLTGEVKEMISENRPAITIKLKK